MECESVDWNYLVQDWNQLRVLVNTNKIHPVP
jgi:hypothetical protein